MSMFNEILDFLFYFLVGLAVLRILSAFVKIEVSKTSDDEFEQEQIEKIVKFIHVVKQEQHDDTFYWFDQDTGEFLVQGRTDDELRQALRARFKHDIFVLNENTMLVGPDYDTLRAI